MFYKIDNLLNRIMCRSNILENRWKLIHTKYNVESTTTDILENRWKLIHTKYKVESTTTDGGTNGLGDKLSEGLLTHF